MSRGDKETEEVAATEGHSETPPEQSRPAVQYFRRRWQQNLIPSHSDDRQTEVRIHSGLSDFSSYSLKCKN